MPAALPPAGAEDVLYLVDLSGYVFRAYHALPPLSNSRGEVTHAVLGTVNMLQKIIGERRPTMFALALDSRAPTFRHALDARYKATRPAPPPDLSSQMVRVEEIARAYDVALFQKPGLEADDLIAAVTARAIGEGQRVVVVSADKDLMQIVRDDDDRVVLWDSMRDRVYGPAEVREKLGIPPSLVRDYLALTGDTSDNVPGVPSVGPKTAVDLLTQFGSIDGIYAALEAVKRPKLREALREHEADARISKKLVTLDATAPIEWSPDRLRWGGADVATLRRLFTELEFQRQVALLDQVPAAKGSKSAFAIASAAGTALGTAGNAVPQGATPAGGPAEGGEAGVALPVTTLAALESVATEVRASGLLGLAVLGSDRDAMRATLFGIALAARAGRAHYVPLVHRYLGAPAQLSWEAVRGVVAPLLASPSVIKVAHDAKYASIVLGRFGAPVEGPVFDTQIAAYLIDPESSNALKDVAKRELGRSLTTFEDTIATRGRGPAPTFDELEVDKAAAFAGPMAEVPLAVRARHEPRLAAEGLDRLMNEVETPLAAVLAAIETRGVLVDLAVLAGLSTEAEQRLRGLEAECKHLAGKDFVLRSRDQLEAILFDDLSLPVLKRTPKGGRSTDADVLEALAEKHPLPAKVLEFRELDKLKGTYIDALPRYVNPATGRIHTRFDQAVAATGRLSSSDPNLQNIPIRTEFGRAIRAAFVAPPGHVILSADYSQIELRVLAHLAHDPELIDAFASGEDVHARTAALVFGKPRAEVTADERRAAKTINFGVIYGMGDSALSKQIGVTRERAAQFIEAYFERYAGVARFMARTVETARQGEAVRSLLGRRRFLPNLHSANRALRLEAERVARNTPIQGTAADILKLAMVALGGDVVPGARMILTVHDELVFEVEEGREKAAGEIIRDKMANAVKLEVPLVVDVGSGKSWASAH
jgi:DNA polymerase I